MTFLPLLPGAPMRFITKVAIGLLISTLGPLGQEADAAAPIIAAGHTFQCTPVAVYDGDGPVWCAEGPKIRIAGVAAREMDGTCRPNQPCPPVGALDARDRLVRLLGGPRGTMPEGHIKVRSAAMTCVSEGSAGGSRTAAWCSSPAVGDLSCAVVRAGGAVRWARFWRNHRC
jgi:endonuclease YncB( thermonuclease family)